MQLLTTPVHEIQDIAPKVLREAKAQLPADAGIKVVQLVEELLIARFPELGREEMRMKFKLHDVRGSKVWKEAHDEGIEQGKILAQQDMIRRLLAQGWTDAIRHLNPGGRVYTFWDYTSGAWRRNAGLRIDHLLLNPAAASRLAAAGVDRDVRGWEKTSDHAPTWVEMRDT